MEQKQINRNWKEFELGEVCKIDAGQGAPQGDKYFSGKEIFVRAGDLNKLTEGVYVGDYCSRIGELAIDEYKLKKYPKNSIVFPKSGMSVKKGNIAILKDDSYVVNHLAILTPSKEFDNIFLFYLLKKIGVSNLCKNDSYPSIRLTDIKLLKISLPILSDGTPDLEKQKQIVAILEKADGLKDRRNGLDELFDEYLKSVFYEMFLKEKGKFEEVILGEISKISMGGTPLTSKIEYWEPGKINWMKSGNIKGDYIRSVPQKISKEGLEKSNATVFLKGTVVIALNGQGKTRGTSSILAVDTSTNQSVAGIMINQEKILSEYLHYNFKMRYTELRNITGDDSRSGLNLTILRNFKVVLPSISLQRKFVSIVEQIGKVKDKLKDEKKDSDELFNALMQKAFSGGLI